MSISLLKNTNNEKFRSWVIFFGFEFFSSVKKHWTELLVNWTLNWTELEVQFSSVHSCWTESSSSVQFSSELKNPVQGQHWPFLSKKGAKRTISKKGSKTTFIIKELFIEENRLINFIGDLKLFFRVSNGQMRWTWKWIENVKWMLKSWIFIR